MRRFPLLALLAMGRPAAAGPLLDRLKERFSGIGDDDAGDMSNGMSDSGPFTLPSGATVQRDVPYGNNPAQRLDVYRPANPNGAPLMFMVHGGGWNRGDKEQWRSIKNKVTRWVGKGWVVVSINYRLIPEANPVEQADDVARALGYVQQHAAAWGADASRILVMGHSAGAHLVGLLTADPDITQRYGVKPWRGTVTLDSAAFDVTEIMNARHFRLYDKAWGDDPKLWKAGSPTLQLQGKPVAPLLAVCSTRRSDSCPQAEAFAAKARKYGGEVQVMGLDISHGDANDMVGAPGALTDAVEAFTKRIGLS